MKLLPVLLMQLAGLIYGAVEVSYRAGEVVQKITAIETRLIRVEAKIDGQIYSMEKSKNTPASMPGRSAKLHRGDPAILQKSGEISFGQFLHVKSKKRPL